MNATPGRILLGHISGAQGIKGEVIVHAHTAAPEDIAAYGPLRDETGTRTFRLRVLRVSKKGVICRIDGIGDRTAAEALRGTALYVERSQLPPPAEDEFYHADLVGLAAVDAGGAPFGTVVAVHNFGADDILEIRLDGSTQTEMLPFTRACVPSLDIAGGRIVVQPPAEAADDDLIG